MNMNLLRNGLAVVIILLLAISSITPTVFGYNLRKINNEASLKTFNYDRYDLPEFYDCNNVDKLPDYEKNICIEYTNNENTKSDEVINPVWPTQPLNAPIDSVWPTYCHDVRHTGRSPYSTVDTWERIWKIETRGWAQGGPVIDKDKVVYIGAYRLYAVYPNGTFKWEYTPSGNIMSCPTIDDNGVIYFGTTYGNDYLYALYSNGTLKWKYNPSGDIFSSPVIGDDVIYFGSGGGYPPTGRINALYSNGTLKWKFDTNHVVYSSPAIGQDGTVYCGSHDNNVYALYPNNGTLKWKFTTGSWVHGSPTVADDGTVYIGSDDGYLYAIYPNNGTLKWKCNVGCIRASPALDENGILYVGVWEKKFYAIYPNGTIKWVFYPGAKIWGSSAALSGDGTLYFGTCDLESSGGIEIIALYTDGTVKWRKSLDTVFSSPAIGIDGTVYIGSCGEPGLGFLNAFGVGELEANTNGPYYGIINQPVQFTGFSKGGYSPHLYSWDFGDTHTSDEQNPMHIYTNAGNYTVTLTVTDDTSNTSSDTTYAWIQTSNTPPNKPTIIGPTSGKAGTSYDYTFTGTDPDGSVIWYFIDWGDDTNTGWLGPYGSGQQITESHTWNLQGTYAIKSKAKDPYGEEGLWGTLTVTMPKNKENIQQSSNQLILKTMEQLLYRFTLLERLLNPK